MNMNEEQIASTIANFCQDETLYFQIIIQERTLHIYVNRQDDTLKYAELTAKVRAAVATSEWSYVEAIWLYSRLLGELEPDWETFVKIGNNKATAIDNVESLVQEIESEVNNTENLLTRLQSKPETANLETTKMVAGMKTTRLLLLKLKKQLEK